MGKKLNFTDEQIQSIKEMYLGGIGCTTICKHFNCAWSSINKIIKELGIMRPISYAIEKSQEICDKYKSGQSIKSLEKEYGSTHGTISKILRENNIEIDSIKPRKEFIEMVIKDYQENEETIRALSRKYKVDRRTIQHILLRAGVVIRGSELLCNISNELEERIKTDLISGNIYGNEAAKKYNVLRKVISKIVAKYNIKSKKQESTVKIIFNDKQIEHITESYGKTENLLSLSKIYKCARTTIKQVLIENNITLLGCNISKELQQRNKYLDSITLQIIQDYNNDICLNEIRAKYNTSFKKLIEIFKRNNVKLKPKGFYSKIHFTDAQKEEIVTMYLNGRMIYEITEKFQVSYPTISSLLKERKIKLRRMGIPIQCNNRSWGISGHYKGNNFRSINELSFMINYLEVKNINFTMGEKTPGIEYYDTVLQKTRTYFTDFITDKYIFENKPKAFWSKQEVLDKAIATREFCQSRNLIYRIIDYPVIIEPILEKYFNDEIEFSKSGSEKFCRIYKKYLN